MAAWAVEALLWGGVAGQGGRGAGRKPKEYDTTRSGAGRISHAGSFRVALAQVGVRGSATAPRASALSALTMKKAAKATPRLSLYARSLVVALRDAGHSFREIAANPRIRKQDKSKVSQQGIRKAFLSQAQHIKGPSPKKKRPDRRGRPAGLTEKEKAAIEKKVEKDRYTFPITAPWLRRVCKLTCSVSTVGRFLRRLGYRSYLRGSKKILDKKTMRKRFVWANTLKKHGARFWQNRAFADAHYWYVLKCLAHFLRGPG